MIADIYSTYLCSHACVKVVHLFSDVWHSHSFIILNTMYTHSVTINCDNKCIYSMHVCITAKRLHAFIGYLSYKSGTDSVYTRASELSEKLN